MPPETHEVAHIERLWGESARWKSTLILVHPIGVLLYVAITFACAVIAARGVPPVARLAPMLLAMFFSQCAVGIANELADRSIDAMAKPWRPIPAGYVTVSTAVLLGAACVLLAGLFGLALSTATAVLLLCGTATGILYSAWLKRTPLSWVPYAVTYPGFPLWVWLALGLLANPLGPGGLRAFLSSPTLPLLLVIYPVMIPLALAAHLCNQLRDYDDDLAQGVRGVVHALSKPRAVTLCFVLLLLGPLPLLVYPWPPQPVRFLIVFMMAGIHWLVTAAGMRRYAAHREANDMRRLFRLLQLTGPLLALTWLATVVR